MSIEELINIVPPPAQPTDVSSFENWQMVQKKLKLRLPDELRQFEATYGTGYFEGANSHLVIYNPLRPDQLETVLLLTRALKNFRKEDRKLVPYPVYPSKSGLIYWGKDIDGNGFLWLTKGEADRWPILTRDRSFDTMEMFEGGLINFLVLLFTGRIKPGMWTKPFTDDTRPVTFHSTSAFVPLPPMTTLYELYAKNGNNVGFTAYSHQDTSRLYVIKSIDGRTSGPLQMPSNVQHSSIIADEYRDGALSIKDLVITSGFIELWNILEA